MLTPAQIEAVAANAGFTGPDLATAVAIALAESNPPGNEQSYNPETQAGAPPGKGSYGLWQIYLNAHPEFAGENLYDPQTNANAAYQIYAAAGGFSPWSTYGSGKYQAYLSQVPAAMPVSAPPVYAAIPPAPLTLDASTGLPVATAAILPPVVADGSPSIGTVLFWSVLGIFALWIFEEAS